MGVKGVSHVGADQCASLVGPCFVRQHLVSFLGLQSSHSGRESWPRSYTTFSCSTQLSIKFIRLINIKWHYNFY